MILLKQAKNPQYYVSITISDITAIETYYTTDQTESNSKVYLKTGLVFSVKGTAQDIKDKILNERGKQNL